MTAAKPRRVLVSDFDGTMTRYDFFDRAFAFAPPGSIPDYWSQYERGELSHFEALRRIFAGLPANEEQLWEIAQQTELDPELPAAVDRLQQAGWEVMVASAGCDWYIRRLLAQAGVDLPVHSNPGEFQPPQGLTMHLPSDSPYLSVETGIDKQAIVRSFQEQGATVAYAGDGRPDRGPLLLVEEPYRLATGWVAESLAAENIPFHRISRFADVADVLLQE